MLKRRAARTELVRVRSDRKFPEFCGRTTLEWLWSIRLRKRKLIVMVSVMYPDLRILSID